MIPKSVCWGRLQNSGLSELRLNLWVKYQNSLVRYPTLHNLLDRLPGISESACTSFWHQRRVEDAVSANRDLSSSRECYLASPTRFIAIEGCFLQLSRMLPPNLTHRLNASAASLNRPKFSRSAPSTKKSVGSGPASFDVAC